MLPSSLALTHQDTEIIKDDNTWEPGPALPPGLNPDANSFAVCPLDDAADNDRFLLVGGALLSDDAELSTAYIYDWSDGVWTQVPDVPAPYTSCIYQIILRY